MTGARMAMDPHRPSTRLPGTRAILAALLAALGTAHLIYHASYTLDDAYISFRYARNLARGAGLVFNPGEYVKGYSNTLFTLLTTIPELFGRDPILLAKAIGFVSFCAVCVLGYRLYAGEPDADVRDRGVWFVALCAVSTPLAVHSVNGLETALYTVLILAAVMARLREQRTGGAPWSALLFCAVVLSRPEGIAVFVAMALHDAALRAHRRSFSPRDAAFYALPLLVYAGELGLSQLYYGDPLPQTYYAKVRLAGGLGGGLELLWQGLLKQAGDESYLAEGLGYVGIGRIGLLLLPLCTLAPGRGRLQSAFGLVLLAQLVFVVRAGNDWAPAFRFGTPALPLLFVLVLEAIAGVVTWLPAQRRLAAPVLTAAVIAISLPANVSEGRTIAATRPVDAARKLVEGEHLAELAEPGITLSTFDIGGQGYAAGGFDILDTAGLTAPPLSHCHERLNKACKRYVALIRPELIRVHPRGRDAPFVADPARKSGLYAELDEGRLLILRSLLLVPAAPERSIPVEHGEAGDLVIVAAELPPAIATGSQAALTLYWKKQRDDAAVPSGRSIEWRLGSSPLDAHASAAVWTRMQQPQQWTAELTFADRVVIRAPDRAGRYSVWARVQGSALHVGDIRVVSAAEARASARTTVEHAIALARGRASEPRDADAALRSLREVKGSLLRAYWLGGGASSELRAEIDANSARFAKLVNAELAATAKK
jgi:arabinofuranosyltransferase